MVMIMFMMYNSDNIAERRQVDQQVEVSQPCLSSLPPYKFLVSRPPSISGWMDENQTFSCLERKGYFDSPFPFLSSRLQQPAWRSNFQMPPTSD